MAKAKLYERMALTSLLGVTLVLLGTTFVRNILWRTDIALWEDTVAKSPDKARVNYQLGRVYGNEGYRDQAFRFMGKAKQLDPALFDKHLSRAEDYRQRGMLVEATEEYRKMLQKDPNQPVLHNDLGAVLHAQLKPAEAFAEFNEAIRLDPSYAMAYANRGVINVEAGSLDHAIADFRKAIELDPEKANFHAKLGYAYLKRGRPDEAVAAFDDALRLDPKNDQARQQREQALQQLRAMGGARPDH